MSSAGKSVLAWVMFMALGSFYVSGGLGLILPVKANTPSALKKFNSEVLGESGCPIQVFGAVCELELDPFGAAFAARHYIDYRNVSNRPIAAVKFRIGYVNSAGIAQKPYSNGSDDHLLQPSEQGECRFRGEKIDPATVAVKVRVLKVKYADGNVWDSVKGNAAAQAEQAGFTPLTAEPEMAGGQAPTAAAGLTEAPAAPRGAQAAGAPPGFAMPPEAPPAAFGFAPSGGMPPGDGGFGAVAPPAFAGMARPPAPPAQMPPAAPPQRLAEPDMPPHVPAVHLTGPADPMAALDQVLGTGAKKAPPAAVTAPAAAPSDQAPLPAAK